MSLPRQLSYLSDEAGLALQQEPIIAPLRARASRSLGASLASSAPDGGPSVGPPFELQSAVCAFLCTYVRRQLYSDEQHWTEIGFDTNKKEFYIDRTRSGGEVSQNFPVRTTAPLVPTRPYDLTLVVDRSSVEAYAQNGTIAMTDLIYPSSSKLRVRPFPKDAKILKPESQLWELRSIWNQQVTTK